MHGEHKAKLIDFPCGWRAQGVKYGFFMGWIIFYTVLLISYIGGWAYSLYHPNHIPDIISKISGLVALLSAMGMALQKFSLRVYFFFQRIAIRFFPDTTSRWWFSARYDGHFRADSVRQLILHFQGEDFRFPVRVEREDNLSARIDDKHPMMIVEDGTVVLQAQYQEVSTELSLVILAYERLLKSISQAVTPKNTNKTYSITSTP